MTLVRPLNRNPIRSLIVRRAPDLAEPLIAGLLSLLTPGAAQLIMHPLEYGSMFQDRAGTIPVTASGQLLGHCLDAGPGGYHATAVSDPARGIFRDVGGYRWIEYNGANTAYQTAALPAPGVDKAQVFAGVFTENGFPIVELGVPAIAGCFSLQSNATFASQGTNFRWAISAIVAGSSRVITGLGDISGSVVALRVNGTQVALNTVGQGSGNYNPSGSYPLYYGARAGTMMFFKGYHYATLGPIVRFSAANATPEQITAVEALLTAEITGAP